MYRPDKCHILFGVNRLVWNREKGAVPVCPFCILMKITVRREHETDMIS